MKKSLPYLLLALITLLVIGVYTKRNNNRIPQKAVSVRLKWIHQAQFAGFYTAKSKNYYANEGLSVEINPGGPEISPTQMVLSGNDNFGVIGADQLILAREKGIPLVALAVIYRKTPVAFASLKTNPIMHPEDFKNKKVALVYGRDEEVIYRALLNKTGVDRATIKEVPLTFDLAQLTTGKVDAIMVYETNEPILLAKRGFDVNLIKPRDYGIDFYADTLFTTEKMISENPALVKKFVKATIKGWEYTFQDKDFAVNQILAINSALDKDYQAKSLELSEVLVTSPGGIGKSDTDGWEKLQNVLIEQGIQKQQIDLNKLFTNVFLR